MHSWCTFRRITPTSRCFHTRRGWNGLQQWGMPSHNFPIRRVAEDPAHHLDRRRWPGVLAPVAQVLDQGLDLTSATIFVGENGSGKSTLVEAIALPMAYLRKADRQAPGTAPDLPNPFSPIICNSSGTPAPPDGVISCARKPCTAFSRTLRRTRAHRLRTSHSTTCHTENRSWNWRWIDSGDADYGFSTNRSRRSPSQDALASWRS